VTNVPATSIPQTSVPPTSVPPTSVPPTSVPTLWDTILQKGKIVCATSADFPPYESKDAQGQFVGFDMDLIREIGTRLGINVEIQDMAFDSIVASVQERKIDCAIAGLQVTPERAAKVDFTIPYKKITDAYLVKDDSPIVEINSPEEVASYRVGVQSGGGIATYMETNMVETGKMPADKLLQYERYDQALLDLKAGRIDILITHLESAAAYVIDPGGVKIVGQAPAFSGNTDMAIMVPKGETVLVEKLNEALQAIIDDGTRDELMRTWNIPIPEK
jgi:polar amino acid transport system substrate-binding protein